MAEHPLESAVRTARDELRARSFPEPDALLLLGTGQGTLASSLEVRAEIPLDRLEGAPRCWGEGTLLAADGEQGRYWLVEDLAGEAGPELEGEAPWTRGFACWLAAAYGARVALISGAGSALPGPEQAARAGRLALVSDHLNLSGRTPLLGLGETRLGPLFPDQTGLHHRGLRRAALGHAERLGLPISEAVVACTLGPSLETPAEREWMARAGAQVAAQGLADPLLAAAHAGLACLCVVAVLGGDERPLTLANLVIEADRLAPELEELVRALDPELAEVARSMREEEA